jgi:hypothetical protein
MHHSEKPMTYVGVEKNYINEGTQSFKLPRLSSLPGPSFRFSEHDWNAME